VLCKKVQIEREIEIERERERESEREKEREQMRKEGRKCERCKQRITGYRSNELIGSTTYRQDK